MIRRLCSKCLKFFVMYFLFIMTIFMLLAYIFYVEKYYSNLKILESRCYSELSSVKYQLNEITQYKNRLDNLIKDKQKTEESSRGKYNELLQSCTAVKHQGFLCQSQFEELQSECVKVRKKLDEVMQDRSSLRNSR